MWNKSRRKSWVLSAKIRFVYTYFQNTQEASYHAERLAKEVEKEYGTKIKHWPSANYIVDEDVSYWS